MKTIKYFLYTLGLLIFFIVAKPARAFEISPVKSLFTVNSGATQTMVVKIKNTVADAGQAEKNNLIFKLNVLGMKQDEDGRPIFSRGIDAAESWVYPENNLVNIKPGETKSVNFILKIPADAVAGSYYLGLAVEPVLEKSDQSSLATRLVSLLTLEVKGLVQESVIIEKWMLEASVVGAKNWKFDLGLKNNGSIEVLMQGKIAIRNWRGEEIFSEPIILGNKLLAGSKRVLRPEIILRNDINLPGLYSAQVKINYGRANQIVSAIAYVWYFPKWSKIVLGVAASFLILLTALVVKRLRKIKK